MTTDELLDQKLTEGIELLNRIVIAQMQEAIVTAGDHIDSPRVRAAIDARHAQMLKWRDEMMVTIEAALLRTVNRLN